MCIVTALGVLLLIATGRCGSVRNNGGVSHVVLRVGVGEAASASPQSGIRPVVQNLSIEALTRVGRDGRAQPWLAKDWQTSPDGRAVTVQLRENVRFHDGTPLTAEMVAETLRQSLPRSMGPSFNDVISVTAISSDQIKFVLRTPSAFLLDSLEADITKPGAPHIGTGPFKQLPDAPTALRANPDYYLGPPAVEGVQITKYANVRAAWADLLRNRIDAVIALGTDALDSLEASNTIVVFPFSTNYQYLVLLNSKLPLFRSREIRKGLNAAVDRQAIIRDALNGRGTPSSGPVWPKHWAARTTLKSFTYDPSFASSAIRETDRGVHRHPDTTVLRFECLVTPDNERLALAVQRQLQAVGAEMILREASADAIDDAFAKGNFEAILSEAISGPNLFRVYRMWHSRGSLNPSIYASSGTDEALDMVSHSASDEGYTAAVRKLQDAILADPPAIFLAWIERAHAVSKRFEVAAPEPGDDVFHTLRLWRPLASAEEQPSSN
jgi:peptide/nickel transport system substrate-binding protein